MRQRTLRALSFLFTIQIVANASAGSDYGVPIEIQLWDTGRTPLAHMVDVTNEFGLKVLAEHNFLNDNNIAFSPYGLTGILVALYEGVDGESSYQIQRGMQLPWNRNIMRIGFRDIHRTLKTYFVPEEGFLAGLALNNENVTFNDSYRNILRFYGFDLEKDQLPTLPPESPNNATATSSNETSTSTDNNIVTTVTTNAPYKEGASTTSPEREETTPSPIITTEGIDIRGPSPLPSAAPVPNTETMAPQILNTKEINPEPSTVRTTLMATITTSDPITTQTSVTTSTQPAIPPTVTLSSTEITSQDVTETTTTQSTTAGIESTINNEVEILSTPEGTSNTGTETAAADSTMFTASSTSPEATTTTIESSTMTSTAEDTTSTNFETTVPVINEATLETLERKKKSIVDFIFTNPPYMQDLMYHRSFDIGPELDTYGDKMFLINGLRNMQVTYMHYNSILEHAYLPHLEASALRLPLDSDRYYLLVILPSRGGQAELGRLIGRMARESDLRDVHAALRPKRVKAIVPSFTVKGHVTLTTDLQKLGIRDVFEPRQRDFTPMTPQAGVYVRSVEQAVSVAIRKYRPDEHKNNRYVTNRYPVHFSATYPFLYFVMDSNIHVALMAGKMVDPLNTRIL